MVSKDDGLPGRLLFDIIIGAILFGVSGYFWGNALGAILWTILFIGLILLPWWNRILKSLRHLD